jgi:hypothetical protein
MALQILLSRSDNVEKTSEGRQCPVSVAGLLRYMRAYVYQCRVNAARCSALDVQDFVIE